MDPSEGTRSPVPAAVSRSTYRNASRDILYNTKPATSDRQHTASPTCLTNLATASRKSSTARCLIYSLLFALLSLCQAVRGDELYGTGLLATDELVFDRSEPPTPRMGLYARQDASASLPASIVPSETASSGTPTSSETSLATAVATSTALPRPFDTSLGNNFTTTTCPAFFNSFLLNQTFQDCTSSSFFATLRSPPLLNLLLQTSCSIASPSTCTTLLSQLATDLQSSSNCGSDLQLQNPQVLQALAGFEAYPTLHSAACLTNSETGAYCFADAVGNASAPQSSYVYYLPLGVQLPDGTRPGCTQCLKDTMSIFKSAADVKDTPLYSTYGKAAETVDSVCGDPFAAEGVVRSAGVRLDPSAAVLLVAMAAALVLC
ncbi:hypothetical protein B0A48_06471 [Cryoendolithus antarcticus]|uniref:DUF7729 domain-containing protein n=1 Tax=Cryoendolithus antarcticus TaxID=1507870 RepID=A0A1V8TBH4_9PEZI|nr:hypothetical protein B0A48_06471 [Cryoendolithus antarcticus]